MLTRKFYLIGFALVCLNLISCVGVSSTETVDTTNLGDLMNLQQSVTLERKKANNEIRYQGVKESALSVGAQGGLAHRSEMINQVLTKQAKSLAQAFDFNGMLLDHSVLPPVLVEGNHIFNLDSDDTIRIADKTYSLISQAHFVTTVPRWSDYLWMNFTKPAVPDQTLLPKNAAEEKIWRENVLIGWNKGLAQADAIYAANLARLKRDYEGMALYRKLLAKHMINPPFVAKTELGVTGGGANLTVNDRILRITAKPQLDPHPQHWQPILQK